MFAVTLLRSGINFLSIERWRIAGKERKRKRDRERDRPEMYCVELICVYIPNDFIYRWVKENREVKPILKQWSGLWGNTKKEYVEDKEQSGWS